jgi:hypothetical protein
VAAVLLNSALELVKVCPARVVLLKGLVAKHDMLKVLKKAVAALAKQVGVQEVLAETKPLIGAGAAGWFWRSRWRFYPWKKGPRTGASITRDSKSSAERLRPKLRRTTTSYLMLPYSPPQLP